MFCPRSYNESYLGNGVTVADGLCYALLSMFVRKTGVVLQSLILRFIYVSFISTLSAPFSWINESNTVISRIYFLEN